MNDMNELILNLLIRVPRLLSKLLHTIYYHYGYEDSSKLEQSLKLSKLFCYLEILLCIGTIILQVRNYFGSNLVLFSFTQ
jgi:hypothetical protein